MPDSTSEHRMQGGLPGRCQSAEGLLRAMDRYWQVALRPWSQLPLQTRPVFLMSGIASPAVIGFLRDEVQPIYSAVGEVFVQFGSAQ
ncbi:hypothetical protein Pmar_PMAR023584 [Perkinsus marinus ATCC 50983]|uniref:Uncharacterized protein n=1 Tax=Perkinsus marinus (strain ATCC 50983 / TXsc) TaxID=423536 RepID=C5KCR4_PERM5|nr:hypothetical protein Pmar_PMAR023584 [Perkinsus marinus ATCC 50983]EER17663.1 hypothetical protein Pmar_PMAR023584 [Perkinsus marinus ATCC 50983]|eukprot:XP_002785867.1 hypothetical protein Pmar_PMAR023584 [Perkinsus marinus ATCC 50983]